MTEPLTPEEEAALRRLHVVEDPEVHESDAHCDECWGDWPCETARLLATLDAARQPDDRLREALAFIADWANDCDDDHSDTEFGFAEIEAKARAALASHPTPTCAQHIHVAGTGDGIDRCDECGHDLRARCHKRGTP